MADELDALIAKLDGVNADAWDAKPSNDGYECTHFVTVLGGFTVELTAGLSNHLGAIEVSRRRAWGLMRDKIAEYGAKGEDKRIIDLYDRVSTRVREYQEGLEKKWDEGGILRRKELKREFLSAIGIRD